MIFIFLFFLLIFIVGLRFNKEGKGFFTRSNTSSVNGFLIIIIFFNHFQGYLNAQGVADTTMTPILLSIGQLMVAPFFFFSGYGIYENIKKKPTYIKTFLSRRFLPTFLNFQIALLLFVILDLCLGQYFGIKTLLLSTIGWSGIGNSNWFMFATFFLYLATFCSFKFLKSHQKALMSVFLLSIFYIIVISQIKEGWWYDTILCFSTGMYFSHYKDKIIRFVTKNLTRYFVCLGVSLMALFISYALIPCFKIVALQNITAILCVFSLSIIMMKVKYVGRLFLWFGQYIFWIYILQRLPMIALKDFNLNPYLYFIVTLLITCGLAIILKKLTTTLYRRLKHRTNNADG